MKCDNCNKPARIHYTEIRNGKTIEKHLCEQCAARTEGMQGLTKGPPPINELLEQFVAAQEGARREMSVTCENCGISWAEFRQNGLFGCEHDYQVFEKELTPLLQRAHEGATHHIGKVPARAGSSQQPRRRVVDINRLRRELAKAVEAENYEKAAKLRDQIREAESQ